MAYKMKNNNCNECRMLDAVDGDPSDVEAIDGNWLCHRLSLLGQNSIIVSIVATQQKSRERGGGGTVVRDENIIDTVCRKMRKAISRCHALVIGTIKMREKRNGLSSVRR